MKHQETEELETEEHKDKVGPLSGEHDTLDDDENLAAALSNRGLNYQAQPQRRMTYQKAHNPQNAIVKRQGSAKLLDLKREQKMEM